MQGTRFLNQAVANQPQRTATIHGERRRTWREVGERVPRLAAALRVLGIADGAFVAALAMNNDRYIELFFAVPWAGGAFAPLNIRWFLAENAYALTDSRASVLFVDEALVDQARALQASLGWLTTLVYLGEGETPDGMLGFEDLIARHPPMADANRHGEDLWVIFYTGGTTAHPKGVMMSHRGLFVATVSYLALLPSIEDLRFVNHPDFDRFDLSSLKTCVYGGSPMPEALIKLAMARLPSLAFCQVFGMTETGGFATMLRWRDHVTSGPKAARLKSAGQAALGNELRVVLADGSDAGTGQLGEILVRSSMLMSGYLNNLAATAAALVKGWMHTGDAGTLDEDGYLYVADRIKDMIVSGGEDVYSIEVERVLFMHPAVREAAVIGIPSAQWGEAEHAVVVLRDGASVTAEALSAFCREHIGGYKIPRSYEIRSEALPVTPVGEVRKNLLRDPYCVGHDRKIG